MKDSNNRKRKKNRPLDNNVFIEAANDSSDYWEYANKVMPRILATKSGNDIYGNSVRLVKPAPGYTYENCNRTGPSSSK